MPLPLIAGALGVTVGAVRSFAAVGSRATRLYRRLNAYRDAQDDHRKTVEQFGRQAQKVGEALANIDIDISIHSSGFDEFQVKVANATEKEFRRICLDLMNRAIQKTPVDTGTLAGAWTGEFGAVGGELFFDLKNKTEYALFVEHGTERTRPRRMLARAIMEISMLNQGTI